jgi:hypothetical protein
MRFATVIVGALVVGLSSAPIALANPVAATPRYVIDIEYWGTVTLALGDMPHRVGDRIHGTARIDTKYAPPDYDVDSAAVGTYGINYLPDCPSGCTWVKEPSGFVTTPGLADIGGIVGDLVKIEDGGLVDSFALTDFQAGAGFDPNVDDEPERSEDFWFLIGGQDFLDGDELLQQFDVELDSSDRGVGGRGSKFGGVWNRIEFVLDRVRATPRVCAP